MSGTMAKQPSNTAMGVPNQENQETGCLADTMVSPW